MDRQINYCIQCGSQLVHERRVGKIRPVCPECGWIHFPDPKVAVAVLVRKGGGILFVQRAGDPRKGFWTLPAGFVDAGEDPEEAAVREVWEETRLEVEISKLMGILAVKEHQDGADLLIVYRAALVGGRLEPGDDAADAEFFPEGAFPPLAFKSTAKIFQLT